MTHTYVTMAISTRAYAEITNKLHEAGYGHVFTEDGVDMGGIALTAAEDDNPRHVLDRMEREFMSLCDSIAKASPVVGREMAVAKTQMQTAMLWAHDAAKKAAGGGQMEGGR
jgi:hypothetical protein